MAASSFTPERARPRSNAPICVRRGISLGLNSVCRQGYEPMRAGPRSGGEEDARWLMRPTSLGPSSWSPRSASC